MPERVLNDHIPSDGSEACIACPTSVRDLLATVHNFLSSWDADRTSGYGGWDRVNRKLEEMRESHGRLQQAAEAHFADPEHAGTNRKLVP